MIKFRYILFLLCIVRAGSTEVWGQDELNAQIPAPFVRGNETRFDSRQSETFFQAPLVRDYNASNNTDNLSFGDEIETIQTWPIQIGTGLEVDETELKRAVFECRRRGSEFISFWESLASIQSVSRNDIQIVVQNQPNESAVVFSDGTIYLNRPSDWKSDNNSKRMAKAAETNNSGSGIAKSKQERASALKKVVLTAQLYQNGYQQIFSPDLIEGLTDCFAYPGAQYASKTDSAIQSGAITHPTRQSGKNGSNGLTSDWIRFSLYASDGQYAGDFFQNISDNLRNNPSRIQYLTSGEPLDETILSGNSLPVLKRGRDQAERIIPGTFAVQKRSGTSLVSRRTIGNQSLNQKTRAGFGNGDASAEQDNSNTFLEISDLVDFAGQQNAFAQWTAIPEANTPAIRVSPNLSQTPANRLPEEAQRMIALVKLAHRGQVSFLKEEITPAVFNHTNYQDSLKPKMVLTRTKTLGQVRSELFQATDPNTFFLDPVGNLRPVRSQSDWDALFSGNGSPLKIGQDQQGEFLTSVTPQGDRFRVRLVEIKSASSDNVLQSDDTSVRPRTVILVEKF